MVVVNHVAKWNVANQSVVVLHVLLAVDHAAMVVIFVLVVVNVKHALDVVVLVVVVAVVHANHFVKCLAQHVMVVSFQKKDKNQHILLKINQYLNQEKIILHLLVISNLFV